jgi:site-specific DNA recombinase
LERPSAEPRLRRTDGSDYLLSGLALVCDRCGHTVIWASANGRHGKRYAYYTCYSRSRYGTSHCDQARLPKDELEQAILSQMGEVYADAALIEAALAAGQSELRKSETDRSERLTVLEAEAADTRIRMDRYFASFEAGQMSPQVARGRVEALRARLQVVEDERAVMAREKPTGPFGTDDAALISWTLTEALADVRKATPTPRSKALLRLLIEEIRVVSPMDIRPTYRVPAVPAPVEPPLGAVRLLEAMVEMRGLEPLTPAMRTRCSSS